MKAMIIVFSPSGNTARAATALAASLDRRGIESATLAITGDSRYFDAKDHRAFLREMVPNHDLLFIGAPVYAHHLQYHMKELIAALPTPKDGWGNIALPFVTYGGISSGIALEEACKLLEKSGRTVIAGAKIASPHRMTRAFMPEEFNANRPESSMIHAIEDLVDRIAEPAAHPTRGLSKGLRYQPFGKRFAANAIFVEKRCHKKMYPKVTIGREQCTGCGRCAAVCPVCRLERRADGTIATRDNTDCIHCCNCIVECPQRAIRLEGDIERARSFMERMIRKGTESPESCVYPEQSEAAR